MEKALSINNLHKTYQDGFVALDGVNLVVEQGDFFALLGPNGAGKSTIIGIITSLINKTSGSVKVFGFDLDHDLQNVQRSIGVVPQDFNFNRYENVKDIIYNQAGFYGLSRKNIKDRVEYYLKKFDLWDKRNVAANYLSGGMKRRLMIARGMIHDPKLLILDEPTAGVDLEIRRATWDFIREINAEKRTTIILTTHYLEEAEELCKNIAIIDNGKIIEQADMKSLLGRLDKESVVLDVEGEITPQSLSIDHYILKQRGSKTIEVTIDKSQSITKVFVELEKRGITVKSMRNKENRLETLFLDLIKKDDLT